MASLSESIIQKLEKIGLSLQKKSEAKILRPPQQNESFIYLYFVEENNAN